MALLETDNSPRPDTSWLEPGTVHCTVTTTVDILLRLKAEESHGTAPLE